MKGLTHFVSGIATVTFFPEVVHRAMAARSMVPDAGSSFLIALAGMFAIMPDTLDFKLGRFLERADVEVTPDHRNPDAQAMADKLGQTMDRAWEENRSLRIQFHTLQYASDKWQRYRIRFDTKNQAVSIEMKDIVSTSQVPYPGTTPDNPVGTYKLKSAKLLPGTTRDNTVDIMSGPMYGFIPHPDYLEVEFLPWHRTWSHSYTLGAALSVIPFLIALFAGWSSARLYFLMPFLAFATHITEDLTGHMGGSLIWPFVRKRTRGLCLFHAANPSANFITDLLAVNIIIFNLDRFGPHLIPLNAFFYFMIFFIGPAMLYFLPRVAAYQRKPITEALKETRKQEQRSRRIQAAIDELESESDSVIT